MVHNALEHGLAGDGRTNDQPALASLVEGSGVSLTASTRGTA